MIVRMGLTTRFERRRRKDRDKGAALVEAAFITPLLLMLLLGTVTAAIAYSQHTSLQTAAREASRFGATLPAPDVNVWLNQVMGVAKNAAIGDLASDVPGQKICVAYVHPSTGQTRSLTQTGGVTGGPSSSVCFDDGRPADEARVQVLAERSTTIQAVLFSRTVTLSTRSAARFER